MITSTGGFFVRQAFGKQPTVDNLAEASEAVESILESAPEPTPEPTPAPTPDAATPAMAALVAQYIDRVRLLTWVVVLMAIVLVAKELKQ